VSVTGRRSGTDAHFRVTWDLRSPYPHADVGVVYAHHDAGEEKQRSGDLATVYVRGKNRNQIVQLYKMDGMRRR
jgi:hypothetical protein